jgi:alpha-beta hydrolase superfamily lysophospholipase
MIPLNDPALFTGEPRWQEFIRRDELGLYVVTIDFSLANHALTSELEQPRALQPPALLMLAGRDDIINNTATRAWFERVAAGPRKIIEYPEARHTLEFEPDPDRIINDLIGWLDERFAAPPGETNGCTRR